MTQTIFNFTTNIELRMPTDGRVYAIDRMTSEWAQAHPFDVDGYLEEVYQKWQQAAEQDPYVRAHGWAKSREELRGQWERTLSMTERGDKRVCPWSPGCPQPALLEVWHKAGDYWRRGFRTGDVLPALVPMCKITRIGDGSEWIALFPKDMGLLTECADDRTTEGLTPSVSVAPEGEEAPTAEEPTTTTDIESATESEPISVLSTDEHTGGRPPVVRSSDEPLPTEGSDPVCSAAATEQPLFTQAEVDALVAERLAQMEAEHSCPRLVGCATSAAPAAGAERRRAPRKPRTRRTQPRPLYRSEADLRPDGDTTDGDNSAVTRKILAALGAAAVTLLIIHFFGLLGPALVGLVCGGVLKG